MSEQWMRTKVHDDWARARRQALWEALFDTVARRSGELLSLDDVRTRLNVRGSRYRGLQHVPLEKIVGSEGRYGDFDRRFLPRRSTTAERWKSIDRAQYNDINLPPVDLYKIGDVYFVKDGNHRVSVARQRGQADIDAYVTEYEVDVPIDPSVSVRDLILKEEYSDFLDWTQLARFRPQQRIELSALGGYLELINHINVHRYYLGIERNGPVSSEEAVKSWYDNVYTPIVEVIRRNHVLSYFPGRTEADLYLWIMQHRHYMREATGVDPGPEAATMDYATRFGRRSLRMVLSDMMHAAGQAAALLVAPIGIGERQPAPSLALLDFIEWSQIDRTCPSYDIRLSNDADYARLRAHLEEHQYHLSDHLKRPATLEEAIRDWCEYFYAPTVEAIREHNLLGEQPDRTETDLYLEAVDLLMQEQGTDGPVGPEQALATLQERRNHDGVWNTLKANARRLLRWRK
jgi:hypothetical protein